MFFSKEEEEKTMRSNIALTVIIVLLVPENSADLFEVIRIKPLTGNLVLDWLQTIGIQVFLMLKEALRP